MYYHLADVTVSKGVLGNGRYPHWQREQQQLVEETQAKPIWFIRLTRTGQIILRVTASNYRKNSKWTFSFY